MNINSEAMAEEPREEEEPVRIGPGSGPQIISSESITPGAAALTEAAGAAGAAGAARGAAAGAELGRRLLLAARAGDAQAVLDLMAQGAPFTTDWLGTSPLHLAAAGGHVAAAGVLLRAGVSRDARTKVERTPLHLAAHAGHARVAALLLDHGALPDTRDMLRMTPLHWACGRGHATVAALLARRGADPRARCKFRRTPLQLASPAVRRAVLAALQERAKHSTEEMTVDENATTEQKFETVQMPMSVDDKPVIKIQQKIPKPNIEVESGQPAAAAGSGAAALLRQHGITLLPVDETSTVLSALQSGRTVVLSDAGKLMLKESSSPPPPGPSPSPSPRGGVVVRATPAREPPRPGVKVFTVSKLATKLAKPAAGTTAVTTTAAATTAVTTTAAAPAQLRKILDPQDMQIKYVQLPPEPPASPAKPPMKAKARAAGAGSTPAGGGVKIIMNKASFSKLVATAARAHSSGDNEPLASVSGCGEAVVCVPEQFVRSMSARYLRAQLLAAHAALAALSRELRAARAQRS